MVSDCKVAPRFPTHRSSSALGVKLNPLGNMVKFIILFVLFSLIMLYILSCLSHGLNLSVGNQGSYQSQPIESASRGRPGTGILASIVT